MSEPDIAIRPVLPLPPHNENVPGMLVYHVELYNNGAPYPDGMGTVVEHPGGVYLAYLFVLDGCRREGIGTQIIKACVGRWPALRFDGTMDEDICTGKPTVGRLLIEQALGRDEWETRKAPSWWTLQRLSKGGE